MTWGLQVSTSHLCKLHTASPSLCTVRFKHQSEVHLSKVLLWKERIFLLLSLHCIFFTFTWPLLPSRYLELCIFSVLTFHPLWHQHGIAHIILAWKRCGQCVDQPTTAQGWTKNHMLEPLDLMAIQHIYLWVCRIHELLSCKSKPHVRCPKYFYQDQLWPK